MMDYGWRIIFAILTYIDKLHQKCQTKINICRKKRKKDDVKTYMMIIASRDGVICERLSSLQDCQILKRREYFEKVFWVCWRWMEPSKFKACRCFLHDQFSWHFTKYSKLQSSSSLLAFIQQQMRLRGFMHTIYGWEFMFELNLSQVRMVVTYVMLKCFNLLRQRGMRVHKSPFMRCELNALAHLNDRPIGQT
jgi:hypothetical protein